MMSIVGGPAQVSARCPLAVLGLIAALIGLAAAAPTTPRLLVVTHSAGFEHEVVRRPAPDRLSVVERVIGELGSQTDFVVEYVHTRADLERLSPISWRRFQAVLFFTTGSLPMAVDVRRALFAFVRGGGGFVGVHSASDTWYDVPEYGELLGAYFDGHPWHQRVRLLVEDRGHPSTRHLGETVELTDEIYQFRAWARDRVHVLLRLDPRSIDVTKGARADGDYALAWTRRHGDGRVFYTALGHDAAVWADPRFRQHVAGGIAWALTGRP